MINQQISLMKAVLNFKCFQECKLSSNHAKQNQLHVILSHNDLVLEKIVN